MLNSPSFSPNAHNPDVLTCLANLSSDEVFTPPHMANRMLDLLPAALWCDETARFLDPMCKSGVFLREMARRLDAGLAEKIPDPQTRLNHIFQKQLFGLAITDLTALLARRSVYCSKTANGKYSVCDGFADEQGNVRFERVAHSWKNGRCGFCGASEKEYERGETLETHAYQFIHTENPEELFKMKFDVIIGNPPYQLSTGGSGVQAIPLYHKFVLQAKKLNPRYLTMIIPARWYSGGFGLDSFRDEMLKDNRIRNIVDYPEASDAFSNVQIKGGVCYFLWDRDNPGNVKVSTFRKDKIVSEEERPLLEAGASTFVRYNEAISILHKVRNQPSHTMDSVVSSQKPFGFATTYVGTKAKHNADDVLIYGSKGNGYCPLEDIKVNVELVDQHKVLIPRAGSGSDKFPHSILGRSFIPSGHSACTETYVVIGPFGSEEECSNVRSYISTRFFRFLVMLMKPTQDALKRVYSFVPIHDFTKPLTDEMLYKKYGLVKNEIAFIESMIRPMIEGESDDE